MKISKFADVEQLEYYFLKPISIKVSEKENERVASFREAFRNCGYYDLRVVCDIIDNKVISYQQDYGDNFSVFENTRKFKVGDIVITEDDEVFLSDVTLSELRSLGENIRISSSLKFKNPITIEQLKGMIEKSREEFDKENEIKKIEAQKNKDDRKEKWEKEGKYEKATTYGIYSFSIEDNKKVNIGNNANILSDKINGVFGFEDLESLNSDKILETFVFGLAMARDKIKLTIPTGKTFDITYKDEDYYLDTAKITKSRFQFVYNKLCEKDSLNKEEIETLCKVSEMLFKFLSFDKINIGYKSWSYDNDKERIDIDISSQLDRKGIKLKIFDQEKVIDWKQLKPLISNGRSVQNTLDFKKFKTLMSLMDIPQDKYFAQLKELKLIGAI